MTLLKIKLAVIVALMLLIPCSAKAQSFDEVIDSQYDSFEIDSLYNGIRGIDGDIQDFDLRNTIKAIVSGKWKPDLNNLWDIILKGFFSQFMLSISILIEIIAYALLCAFVANLQHNLSDGSGSGEAAYLACYMLVAAVCVRCFLVLSDTAARTLDDLVNFIFAIYPVLFTLTASSGGFLTSTVFAPLLLAAAQFVIIAIKQVFLPLLMIATALSLADNISGKFGVGRIVSLIKTVIKWSMGIMLTLFVGLASIQGLIAPIADGIAFKTSKFALSNTIPVVGSILADSFDFILGCTVLLKNAVGVAGVIIIAIIVFTPVLRIIAQGLILRLSAALIEPVSDPRIVKCIWDLSEAVSMIFAMLATASLMFIINIAIIISGSIK